MKGYIGAYVLIDTKDPDLERVRNRLLQIPEIVFVHGLIGPSDLICYIDTENLLQLRLVLDKQIRSLIDEGLVRQTETMLVLQSKGSGFSKRQNNPPLGSAWVFCNLYVGDPEPLFEKLLTIEGVINVHAILGTYEMIVYIESEDWFELIRIINDQIRMMPEISQTDTRLVFMRRTQRRSEIQVN